MTRLRAPAEVGLAEALCGRGERRAAALLRKTDSSLPNPPTLTSPYLQPRSQGQMTSFG